MRADFHVHLDKIGGIHTTEPPTVAELTAYVRHESIDVIGGIYEQASTLSHFGIEGLEVIPIFWERNPRRPGIPNSAQAIKLHPFLDKYRLSADQVGPVFDVAASRGLPVLIHSDDRTPELSRGAQFARLAERFPTVSCVIAHSGSYAPPDAQRPGESTIQIGLLSELVEEAIEAASDHQNIFLEISVLASNKKAQLIAARAPRERIILGSDFPIAKGSCGSLTFQESALIRAGFSAREVAALHHNVRKLFPRRPLPD